MVSVKTTKSRRPRQAVRPEHAPGEALAARRQPMAEPVAASGAARLNSTRLTQQIALPHRLQRIFERRE